MLAKNLDKHGRIRNKVVAFRMSEEENDKLNKLVEMSGLTKQDYIIQCLNEKKIVINGNPRVFIKLKGTLLQFLRILQGNGLNNLTDSQAELMKEALNLYSELVK